MRLIAGFLLAFGLGLSLFALILLFGWNDRNQIWAVLIIIVYGFFVTFSHRKEGGAADSIYYLGFIFTLLALCFALLPAAMSGLETINNSLLAARVLSSFSVAITTTLVGLIFRVILVQVTEIEAEGNVDNAVADVVRAAEQVAMELSFTASELQRSRGEILSSLEYTGKGLEEASSKFLATHNTNLQAMQQFAQANVEQTQRALTGSMQHFESSLDKSYASFQRGLNNSSEAFSAAVVKSHSLVEEMQGTIDLIRRLVATTESAIKEGATSLAEHSSLVMGQVSDTAIKSAEAITESMEKTVERHAVSFNTFEANAEIITDRFSQNIAAHISQLQDITSWLEPISAALSKISDNLGQCNAQAVELADIYSKQVGAVSGTADEFTRLTSSIQSLTTVVDATGAAVGSLSQIRSGLERQLKEVEGVNAKLNEMVVNTANSLLTELDRRMN